MSSGEPSPFAGLEAQSHLLLAVSGGADSLGLMLLAARWAGMLGAGAPRLHVATVDHGLRSGSADEARGVAAAARTLGLSHTVLAWEGGKPTTRIQERARTARYALLGAHAAAIGARHLLTGHHAEDQAETVLLRLGRGSGIGGLAGMRRETALGPALTLVRPLLGWAKADLVAVCADARMAVVDDPSNRDPVFARARLRALGPARTALGLETPALLRLAARAARAEEALDAEARRCLAAIEPTSTATTFAARLAPLSGSPLEILLRVLRLALDGVVPDGRVARLERLETLASGVSDALKAGRGYRTTLNGTCVVLRRDTMLVVVPEPARRRGRARQEAI